MIGDQSSAPNGDALSRERAVGGLRPDKLASPVARVLAARIISWADDASEPGPMRLPTELEISEEFGVSKTVAREVTARLVSIRLVTVHHGKRMQVRPPAEWNYLDPLVFELQSAKGVRQLVRELLEARLLIEPEVAARAARSATSAQLDAMMQSVHAMGETLSSPAQFLEHDLAFHREILAAAHNRVIAGIVDDLQAVMRAGREVTNSIPGGLEHALTGHTAVLAAVEARDPEAARTAMREHLLWAAERA